MREVGADPGRAQDADSPPGRRGPDLVEAVAELGVRDVERPGEVPRRELVTAADVEHERLGGHLVHLVRVPEAQGPVDDVRPEQAHHRDRVLGGAVRGCVGEVEVDEVVHGQMGAQRGGEDVDALVDPVRADGLGAEDPTVVGARVHDEVELCGAGEPAGVLGGVQVERAVRHAEGVEVGPVRAGRGGGERPDADDRRAERARDRPGGGVADDVVGDEPSRAVRRAGQGDRPSRPRDGVRAGGRVAGGPDPRQGRAAPVVHDDRAVLAADAGLLEDVRVGSDARGDQDDVRLEAGPVGEHDDVVVGEVLDGGGAGARIDVDAEPDELVRDELRELGLEGREDMLGPLRERDVEPLQRESLGSLEPDVPAAQHDGAVGGADERTERGAVGDGAQGVDARRAEAGQGRVGGDGSGREDERVVPEVGLAVRGAHADGAGVRVEPDDVVRRAHVEVQRGAQALRRLDEKVVGVGDLAADEVRQPAACERHVRAALEHDDLRRLVEATEARGGARTGRDPADDDVATGGGVRVRDRVRAGLEHGPKIPPGVSGCQADAG